MYAAVAYEGVLAKPGENTPLLEGIDVVRALATVGRVVVFSEASQEAVERFCGVHRIDDIAAVISGSDRPGEAPLLVRQVEDFRAGGTRLDTLVLADPELVGWALNNRLAVMLFMAAGSTPPRFRPDDSAGRQTWDEIEQALTERTY